MSALIPAVLVVQNDGKVTSQNRAARRLLGEKKASIAGMQWAGSMAPKGCRASAIVP